MTVHEKTKDIALDNKSRYKPGVYFGDYDIFTWLEREMISLHKYSTDIKCNITHARLRLSSHS